MTRISPADQILLLLRAQLERADRAKRQTARRTGSTSQAKGNAIERTREILRNDDLPEQDARRALISALLLEDFGEVSVNDPQFQSLVDRVVTAIEADETAKALLVRATIELKTSN
jgi:hypothetical protein